MGLPKPDNVEVVINIEDLDVVTVEKTPGEQKMLGAMIDEDIVWKFKEAASSRREDMRQAIRNAALLYIDTKGVL